VRGLLEGRVAIVAGVGPGLGREVALQLAQHGADVVVGARNQQHVESVAAEIGRTGRRARAVRLDVTEPDDCDAVAAACLEAFGRIDVLVNNAFHGGDFARFEDADLDSWRQTMEVNLWGALRMTQAVVPAMRDRGDGRVVMINTMSVRRIRPRFGAYAASKGALETATKTLAAELGPHGIRVNGIHPGYIWGESVQAYFAHQAQRRATSPDDVYREVADETCLGYLPTAAEVAGSVLFFASDLSRPVTGQSLGVNAGHFLG
jgi:NAD(P)-dependent dehydrogenase (short-subunit alcohol dehydrogenase family)